MPGRGEDIHDDTRFGECYCRYEFLEKENEAKTAELDKALREARETRSESRAAREEIRQAEHSSDRRT